MKYPPEVWKTREFDNILLLILQCHIQPEHNRQMNKGLHPPFPQERWPWNSQELPRHNPYFHNSQDLLLNCIAPEIEKVLSKNQNGFQRNWSTTSQIMTIHQILEGVGAKKNLWWHLFVDFSKAFDYTQRKYFWPTVSSKKPSQP